MSKLQVFQNNQFNYLNVSNLAICPIQDQFQYQISESKLEKINTSTKTSFENFNYYKMEKTKPFYLENTHDASNLNLYQFLNVSNRAICPNLEKMQCEIEGNKFEKINNIELYQLSGLKPFISEDGTIVYYQKEADKEKLDYLSNAVSALKALNIFNLKNPMRYFTISSMLDISQKAIEVRSKPLSKQIEELATTAFSSVKSSFENIAISACFRKRWLICSVGLASFSYNSI